MDETLKNQINQMVQQLALAQQQRLAEAGTLLSLEELTTQIGDEFTRQLTQLQLQQRSQRAFEPPQYPCPDCGQVCPVQQEPEPVILQSQRGELEYLEPRCHCSRCRRAFFPSGR